RLRQLDRGRAEDQPDRRRAGIHRRGGRDTRSRPDISLDVHRLDQRHRDGAGRRHATDFWRQRELFFCYIWWNQCHTSIEFALKRRKSAIKKEIWIVITMIQSFEHESLLELNAAIWRIRKLLRNAFENGSLKIKTILFIGTKDGNEFSDGALPI